MTKYSVKGQIYLSEKENLFTSCRLYERAIQYFNKIQIIKYFPEFKERMRTDRNSQFLFDDIHLHLLEESLIDSVKLILVFENIMKAMLLEMGYLPHKIIKSDNAALKSLRKKQLNGKPILISEYLKHDQFLLKNDKYDLIYLGNNTIEFSKLLNEDYQKLLDIPEQIIDALKMANRKRNSLHFKPSNTTLVSERIVKNWELMIEFMNNSVIDRFNDLFPRINGLFNKAEHINKIR